MAESPQSPGESSTGARWRRWGVVALVGYWCLIFTLTHIPVRATALPGHSDKLVHMMMYSGLAFLLTWRLSLAGKAGMRLFAVVMLIAAAYGVIDELLQIPVGRRADILDWTADCAGAIVGIACFHIARFALRG